MKILVTFPLSPQLVQPGLGDSVLYRPELAGQGAQGLRRALAEQCPDAVLVRGEIASPETLAAWQRDAGCGAELIQCTFGDDTREDRTGGGGDGELSEAAVHRISTAGHLPQDLRALGLAERLVMHRGAARRLAPLGISAVAGETLEGSRVTLVGAGIVNLVTAVDLVERGAEVTIMEASPDPRSQPPWLRLGTTHGGANARMFCFTEADNYNEKGRLAYAKMHQVFRQTVSQGGWLTIEPQQLLAPERSWLEAFQAVPRWRAETFTEDIHGFNVASYALWQKLQRRAPGLFEGVGYRADILKLYAEAEKAEAAAALEERLGSLIRRLDPQALIEHHPACRDAVEAGRIGGALEARGFTLRIHDFVVRLLEQLEGQGVRLRWNHRVSAIERSADGRVQGLRSGDEIVRSTHYVLSPGVLGGPLLAGTRSADKIQGILGLWMSFPNLEPRLRKSIKLHRGGHTGEDSNINLGRDAAGRPILVLGSGYGFLGGRSLDMGSPEIVHLFAALEETARRYFPRAHAQARRDGTLEASRRACIRPFTSTGLGIFEVLGTAEGGRLVVASGHNTGGFAQAPAVAEAVTATLEGRSHRMQTLYDPERGIR